MSARSRPTRSWPPATTWSCSTTSRPGIEPRSRPAPASTSGPTRMATASARLLETERIEAILHCAARSLVGESIADPARYYRDNVAGGVALLEAARSSGVGRIVFSSTRRGLRRPGRLADRRGRAAPPDQPVRRDQADVRERARLVRPGVRPAQRLPALLQRGRRDRHARRGPRPRDAPHPDRPGWRRQGATELTIFGDDYPTAGRHLHPRLHPRRGPRRRAPARARGDRARRPAHRRAARAQPRQRRRLLDPRGPRRGRGRRRTPDPVHGRSAPGGRPAGPRRRRAPSRRGPRLATRPADPRRDGRVGLGVATATCRPVTRTDPTLPAIGRAPTGTIWR